MDFQNTLLESLDERIRAVAREMIKEELGRRAASSSGGAFRDEGAESIRAELAKIQAKEFITAREAATLLSCSARHIHNLVDRARHSNPHHPIPFRKVGDTTVFRRVDLIAWTESKNESGAAQAA